MRLITQFEYVVANLESTKRRKFGYWNSKPKILIPKIDSSYFKYLLFWFHNNSRIIPIRNKCLHE